MKAKASTNSQTSAITRKNFRVICSCQNHSGNLVWRTFRGLTRRAKVYGSALIVAAPLAVGATSLPMAEVVSVARAAAMIEDVPVVRPVESLAILTPAVRNDFLSATVDRALELNLEATRERFFRDEVPFGKLIYREARKNDLTPEFVAAVISTESDFRPALISNKNAQGLMQIIPETGSFMGAHDLLDPADNVRVGTRYLRYLHRRFRGNRELVLAAYNAGEGNIARFNGVPPFRETENYLVRVAARERAYHRRVGARVARLRDCPQTAIATASR